MEPRHVSPDPTAAKPRSYRFGRFALDVPTQRLFRDADMVPLTGRVYDTLLALIRNRDRVVSKDELIQMVWQDTVVSEDSLTHNISILRRAFGDDPNHPAFIETNARRGYRFIAEVVESETSVGDERRRSSAPWLTRRVGWTVAAGIAVAAATGVLLRGWSAPAAVERPLRVQFSVESPAGTQLASGGVMSPDGRYLAFVARDNRTNHRRLWVRSTESGAIRTIEGSDGVWRAFWSRDSTAIAFFASSQIKRVGIDGNDPVRVIAMTRNPRPAGGSWSPRGVIVWAEEGSLFSVPESGGTPTLLKKWGAPGNQFVWLNEPQVLDDGEHILYGVTSTDPNRAGTYFGTLTSRSDRRVLPENGARVTYAPPGHLVFIRNGVVMAQSFDPMTGELRGDPVPIAASTVQRATISAAAAGLIAFGGGAAPERLAWVDRTGRTLSTLQGLGMMRNLTLSRDERHLLGDNRAEETGGAWMYDLERQVPARVGTRAAVQAHWSPDGARIAFSEQVGDRRGIFIRPVRAGQPELLLDSEEVKFLTDWTDDGEHLVFVSSNPTTRQDLWMVPVAGDRRPRPFLRTPANEVQAQVSPDGRWIAYASDESGRLEVYVDSFPTPGARMTISNGGGGQPQWRGDGREIFYLAADGSIMSVDVRSAPTLEFGPSQRLFRIPLPAALMDERNVYTVSRDGRRFLIAASEDEGAVEPITMLANWTAALAR